MPAALLVCSCNQHACFGRLSAHHVHAFCLLEHERHTTDGCLCLFLDLSLCFFCTVPMAEEEAAILDSLLELLVVVTLVDVSITIVNCLLVDVLLDVVEQVFDILLDAFDGHILLFERVATHHLHKTLLQVSCTQHKAYRHALQFVVSKLKSRTLVVGIVIFHGYALSLQCIYHWLELLGYLLLLLALANRYNNHLQRRETWR